MYWCAPVIPVLGRLKWEGHKFVEFEARLSYMETCHLPTPKVRWVIMVGIAVRLRRTEGT